MGVGVASAAAEAEGMCCSNADAGVSCAKRLVLKSMKKMMAGRIIDGLQHEKISLSIGHEIHFRESDCGTFGRFCHP
ncbi:MAG TPA: hypothetical protein VM717_11860 [Chthoniobacterales bacterium]|jgi:hypothetical protein|nr:hypothetical protein [Chthoniobacterales bacterium]